MHEPLTLVHGCGKVRRAERHQRTHSLVARAQPPLRLLPRGSAGVDGQSQSRGYKSDCLSVLECDEQT
jgi:hypothetical protein